MLSGVTRGKLPGINWTAVGYRTVRIHGFAVEQGHPACIKGRRTRLPKDVGGIWGYVLWKRSDALV